MFLLIDNTWYLPLSNFTWEYHYFYFEKVLYLSCAENASEIGPLQDAVTWYGINYTGTQITQWDFQNKGKSGWTGKSSFVLEVPLR